MKQLQKIFTQLKKKYNLSNQEQLAKITNVSQPTIGRYLQSQENLKKMRLETFFKLFPNANITFEVDSQEADYRRKIALFASDIKDEDVEKAYKLLIYLFQK